jgi:hypothetical protein
MLLIDRDVGAAGAIVTSVRVVLANPVIMAAWGFIVALLLVIGSIPLLFGLAVVMPVLGHATWHLYRRAVEPNPGASPTVVRDNAARRSARPPACGRPLCAGPDTAQLRFARQVDSAWKNLKLHSPSKQCHNAGAGVA